MKKTNGTKHSLLMSVLALLLCFSMLAGTTFAWFTDSVTSARNQIASGNLDVKLEYAPMVNGNFADYAEVTNQIKVFAEGAKYEPGYTELVKFKVTNDGSLALKYTFDAIVYSEKEGVNMAGASFKLSDYLYTGLAEATATREQAVAAATNKLSEGFNLATDAVLLQPGEAKEFILVLTMPTTTDNEANHRKDAQPELELGVELVASQYTKEFDSFDNLYDDTAVHCDILATPETIDAILAEAEEGTIIGLASGNYNAIKMPKANITLVSKSAVVASVDLNGQKGTVIDGLTFPTSAAVASTQTSGVFASVTDNSKKTGTGALPGAADIVIRNCKFTEQSRAVTAENYYPIYFSEQGRAGVRAHNVTVQNCTFACNAKQYICMNNMAVGDVKVLNNTFGGGAYGTSHNTINATGNSASWTITGNKFCNWNTEKTAIGSSYQGGQVTWTITGNDFSNTDGAVVLALKTSYNANNSTVVMENNTVMGGYGEIVTTPVNGENETVYAGHKLQLDGTVVSTTDAADINATLKDEKPVVIFAGDVEAPLTQGSIYGVPTAISMTKGGIIDGNNQELAIENPQYNGYAIETYGGTIKNLKITSAVGRGIVISSPKEDIYIDNVLIDGPGYAINTTEHSPKVLTVTNSTVKGWTSLAGLEKALFTNCSFGENTGKYWQNMGYGQDYDRLLKPYGTAVFTDCEMEQGYYLDLSSLSAGCTVTLKNCTVNGTVLTAENYADFITIENYSATSVIFG